MLLRHPLPSPSPSPSPSFLLGKQTPVGLTISLLQCVQLTAPFTLKPPAF